MKAVTVKRNRKRRIETFEPCGPVAAMIDNELRGKSKGAKVRFFEDCIFTRCGLKYPKLAQKFQVLREEAANGR